MDIETRRKKQRALMIRAMERQVRTRAQQLYELRGQAEGQELEDWYQAEVEVLDNNILASLYRRLKDAASEATADTNPDCPACP